MKESLISALAAIVFLICTVYIALTGVSAGNFQKNLCYSDEAAKPEVNKAVEHPAFVTFFPGS